MIAILAALVSVAMVGMIIWWFFGKHEVSSATASEIDGVQKIEIIVDGGYKPEVVRLKAGIPAEVTFLRKSSSSCFDEVLLPDFGQQAKLPVNAPYTFNINPVRAGSFTYSCGMHMFFGSIEVVA